MIKARLIYRRVLIIETRHVITRHAYVTCRRLVENSRLTNGVRKADNHLLHYSCSGDNIRQHISSKDACGTWVSPTEGAMTFDAQIDERWLARSVVVSRSSTAAAPQMTWLIDGVAAVFVKAKDLQRLDYCNSLLRGGVVTPCTYTSVNLTKRSCIRVCSKSDATLRLHSGKWDVHASCTGSCCVVLCCCCCCEKTLLRSVSGRYSKLQTVMQRTRCCRQIVASRPVVTFETKL